MPNQEHQGINMSGTDTKKSSSRGQVTAVVSILGRKIACKKFPEGSTLPVEQVLADELGVGRNALREAVKVLSGKG